MKEFDPTDRDTQRRYPMNNLMWLAGLMLKNNSPWMLTVLMKGGLAYDINRNVMSCIKLVWGSFVSQVSISQAFAGVTCTYGMSNFICKEVTRTHG